MTTRLPIARFSLEHNGSSLDQIKPICRIAFEKDDLARIELRRHRAKSQKLKMMWTHSLEEGMSSQSPFNIWIADESAVRPLVYLPRSLQVAIPWTHSAILWSVGGRIEI